jgi:hypothetical protein
MHAPKGSTGRAWRWEIPSHFIASISNKNNLQKFLAAVIMIWVELDQESTPPLSCILALSDNSSAVGWLNKANMDESINKALHTTSRKLATLLLDSECCLYSQHFKGKFNDVADTLSRHDLSDTDLLTFISTSFPERVPSTFSTFNIAHLPPSITSWMTWLLQKISELMESSSKQGTKRQEHGSNGNSTLKQSKTVTTPSSYILTPSCAQESLEHSVQPSDRASFQEKIKASWVEAQSKRPWQNWARSSGLTWGSTPTMAQMDMASILY